MIDLYKRDGKWEHVEELSKVNNQSTFAHFDRLWSRSTRIQLRHGSPIWIIHSKSWNPEAPKMLTSVKLLPELFSHYIKESILRSWPTMVFSCSGKDNKKREELSLKLLLPTILRGIPDLGFTNLIELISGMFTLIWKSNMEPRKVPEIFLKELSHWIWILRRWNSSLRDIWNMKWNMEMLLELNMSRTWLIHMLKAWSTRESNGPYNEIFECTYIHPYYLCWVSTYLMIIFSQDAKRNNLSQEGL